MKYLQITLLASLAFLPAMALAEQLAFPGAEGFGALATGGRAGKVVHVTTLDDSGAGSLREATSGPDRFVIFDVGGVINLKSPLTVASNTTIAGQSAPGDGIAVLGSSVSLSNSTNIIIRHVRFREGMTGPRGKCSININKGSNIILDHCSIEWGRWDCLGVTESSTVTIQWCIIGEGIDPQKFGCLCETDFITFSHNLWVNNQSRNPKAKGKVQYVNNVVYNWGVTGLVGGHSAADHWLDCVNNYFIAGPNSNKNALGQFTATDKVFHTGNLIDLDKDGKLGGWEAAEADFGKDKGAPSFLNELKVIPKIPVTIDPAPVALEKVLAGAGASLKRDAIDTRLVDAVKSLGTAGQVILDPATVGGHCEIAGGTVPTDTDRDGIPDAWETSHQLNPNDAADAMGMAKDSTYTRLEEYVNSLVR